MMGVQNFNPLLAAVESRGKGNAKGQRWMSVEGTSSGAAPGAAFAEWGSDAKELKKKK